MSKSHVTGRPLPLLPEEISWGVRQLCYAARKLPRGYDRVLHALAGIVPSLRQVTIEVDHCGLICLDFRELVCLPLFISGCYKHQLPEDRVLDHLLTAGMKVFDIGANIGYYTTFLSRRVKDNGLIVAVEPMSRAIRLLEKNARLCGPNIIIEQAAIGAETGEAEINEMHMLDMSFVRFGQVSGVPSVKVRTIDQLAQKYGKPDLLKIDVEGAELLALRGASATLADAAPPLIMIEYIAANACRFGGYGLTELFEHFPESRFKRYRIISPGVLQEVSRDGGPNATNDYLIVPLNRLSIVRPMLPGFQLSSST